MKTGLLFVTCALLLTVSCKKKKTEPETDNTPKTNYSLNHSGGVDSQTFQLDTNGISSNLFQTIEWDDSSFKHYRIRTWLKGPNLNANIDPGTERLTLDFFFFFQYQNSDIDASCSCLPDLTSTLLANKINNASSQWNDGSESKEVQILAWGGQNPGGSFEVVNPQISAQAIGNSIRIYGTIASLKVGTGQGRYLTDLHFDYTIPLHP
ncbi:hypothetical protein D3C71_633920 [compost metagenome]